MTYYSLILISINHQNTGYKERRMGKTRKLIVLNILQVVYSQLFLDKVLGTGISIILKELPSENEIDNHYLFVSRDLPRNDRRDDGTYWAWTNQPTIFTSDMHRGYVVARWLG